MSEKSVKKSDRQNLNVETVDLKPKEVKKSKEVKIAVDAMVNGLIDECKFAMDADFGLNSKK